MSDLKQLAALTALNNMLQDSSPSICTIDQVGKMLGVDPKRAGDSYEVLRTLHCVNYSKMPRELRDSIPRMVQECLGVEPTFQFASDALEKARAVVAQIQAEPPAPSRGLVRRLFGA